MQASVSVGPGASTAPAGSPWLDITPTLAAKVAGAVVMMTFSLYLLATGRERGSVARMVWGALFALGSLFFL